MSLARPPRATLGRIARTLVIGAGTTIVFVGGTAAGVLLHLDHPSVRRLVVGEVNRALESALRGTIKVDRLAHVAVWGGRVEGLDLTARDAEGCVVVVARGVSASVELLPLLRSLVGRGPIAVPIARLHVDAAEIIVRDDATGTTSLASAFLPRTTAAPGAPSAGVVVTMDDLTMSHAWAHGVAGKRAVDVDVDGLSAALRVDPTALSATLRPLRVRARALEIPAGAADVTVEGSVVSPLATPSNTQARVAMAARVGQLSATARASLDGGEIDASVDVPRAPVEALTAVAEGLPLRGSVAAALQARGRLDDLRVVGHVDLGDGRVDFNARALQNGAQREAELQAEVVRVSLADSFVGAPAGTVDASVEARASVSPEAGLSITYFVKSRETTIAGQPVPGATSRGTYDGTRLTGTATVEEPGIPITAAFVLAPEAGRPQVRGLDVDVRAAIPSLRRAPRLGGKLDGSAAVRVKGHVTLDDQMSLDGVVTARATALRLGTLSGASADAVVHVSGPALTPSVRVAAVARGLRAGDLVVSRASLRADGELLSPTVRIAAATATGDMLDASAKLRLGAITSARGLSATLSRNGETVAVRIREVRGSASGVSVDAATIEAAGGALHASGRAGPSDVRVRIVSTPFDVTRLGTLVGQRLSAGSGELAVDIDVAATSRGAHGFVRASARGSTDAVRFAGVVPTDLSGAVSTELRLDGHRASLTLVANAPDVGTLVVWSDGLEMAGSPLVASSYLAATGALNATLVGDLKHLAALLPPASLPFDRVAGTATLTARASVGAAASTDIAVGLTTTGLDLETTAAGGVGGVRLRGVELAVAASRASDTGVVAVHAFATDARGELAEAHLTSRPSLAALLSPSGAKDALLRTHVDLSIRVPSRDLLHFPEALPVGALRGRIGGTVSLTGTARDPTVVVTIRGEELTDAAARLQKTPFDLALDGTFASTKGAVTASLATKGRVAVIAHADGSLAWTDLLDRRPSPAWSANAELAFSALPLRSLTPFAGQPIGGCASGRIVLRGLHDDAAVHADVRVDGLRVGDVRFVSSRFSTHAAAGEATVDARFEHDGGELTAKGSVGLAWGRALVPTLDTAHAAGGRLHAVGFRLSTLRPFVKEALGKVDGVLDADLRYDLALGGGAKLRVSGEAAVRDGVVDAALLGQELRAIQAKVSLSPEGELVIREASARGITGRITAEGTAHVDGLALRDATARVSIARREEMAVTYEGVDVGTAWGDVAVSASSDKSGALTVDLKIQRFQLELPEAAARTTQKLDDEPTVKIGTHTDDRFALLLVGPPAKPKPPPSAPPEPHDAHTEAAGAPPPTPPLPPAEVGGLVVRIKLGSEVRVFHGNTIDAWLSGAMQAEQRGGRAVVSGRVNVERGFVSIQGRRFTVEHATASFDPSRPPADPTVTATATYVAPDATLVFADFTGTAEKGKLRLRSEPPLTQSEILSLVVFGSRSGSGSSASTAGTAASVGGGIATQGINKALGDITPLDVSTRVDTTDAQDPRPEVAVALSRKMSASVSYRVGLPMPGQSQDRSMLRVDYRFWPRWSLETTIGDKGTSIVDLVWKLRY